MIDSDGLLAIITASKITNVDVPDDCYQYGFKAFDLDHALLLFEVNKSRLGFDHWHYLQSAHSLLGQVPDGFVLIPTSSSDFKRRFSENPGVVIVSLFLAGTIGLRLETVAKIPTTTRLDKHA